jgi:CBS domain-containing protein
MIAIGLAAVVVREESIYQSQLRSRADAPSHRARFGLPLLGSTPVREVMRRPRITISADAPIADAQASVRALGLSRGPVVDGHGRFVGVVSTDGPNGEGAAAVDAADTTYPSVSSEASLDAALDAMVSAETNWLPVLEHDRIVGVVAMSEVIGSYQTALRRTLRLMTGITGKATLIEATVMERSPFDGTTVADAPWPPGCVALTIERKSQLIAPTPDTPLHAGDIVVIAGPADAEASIRSTFGDTTEPTEHQ